MKNNWVKIIIKITKIIEIWLINKEYRAEKDDNLNYNIIDKITKKWLSISKMCMFKINKKKTKIFKFLIKIIKKCLQNLRNSINHKEPDLTLIYKKIIFLGMQKIILIDNHLLIN